MIVYFYPAAGTPGCTKEACDFRDNLAELNDAGVDVLGVSPDKPAKLATFRDDEGLTFPLLSDADKQVLTAWGAFGEKQMYGKTVTGVIRSTFLVDAGGEDRGGAVQRPGDGSRGEAAQGPEGLIGPIGPASQPSARRCTARTTVARVAAGAAATPGVHRRDKLR